MNRIAAIVALATVTIVVSLAPPSLATQDAAALHAAVRAGDIEQVRALLDQGVAVDAPSRYGSTALFFAADRGHVEIARLLLERGADPDTTDTFYGATALVWALQGTHYEVALLLLEHGAEGAGQALFAGIQGNAPELVAAALDSGRIDGPTRDAAMAAAERAQQPQTVVALRDLAVAETAEPPPFTFDPQSLADYVGLYRNENEGVLVDVTASSPHLLAQLDGAEHRFEAAAPNSFRGVEAKDSVLAFGGRGGSVEFAQLRLGERTLALSPVDPEEAALLRGEAPTRRADTAADTAESADPGGRYWPAFRGTAASGIGDGLAPPVSWDVANGDNVAWKTAIPGIANSSPIVWDDRVFVTTAVSSAGDEEIKTGLYGDVAPVDDLSAHDFKVYALDLDTGSVLWERTTFSGPPATKRHTKSSQANSTPVTDGERVVVLFGSVGLLVAYDLDGSELWRNEVGVLDSGWFYDPDYQWGHGSSPILYDDTVIVQADVQGGSYLVAYDLTTGQQRWRTDREEIPTWGTPAIYRGMPRDELVTNGTTIRAYDPRTGAELWTLGPNSELAVATPIVGDGIVYVTAGYPPIRPIYAVRPGGSGDISLADGVDSSEDIVWSKNRGGTYIPSPLLYRGLFYTNANNGRLTAYDARTGDMVYRARIGETSGSYVASPVAADGRLYFSGEDGTIHVVRAGDEYEHLATNEMNDIIWATPAMAPGRLIVRTLRHVYALANE